MDEIKHPDWAASIFLPITKDICIPVLRNTVGKTHEKKLRYFDFFHLDKFVLFHEKFSSQDHSFAKKSDRIAFAIWPNSTYL